MGVNIVLTSVETARRTKLEVQVRDAG